MEQDAKNENRLVGIDLACIYKLAGREQPSPTRSGPDDERDGCPYIHLWVLRASGTPGRPAT